MDNADDISFDSIVVGRLKRAAAGLPVNGRPTAENDRLLAQNALNARLAKPKGGGSLFSLVNALHAHAMFSASREAMPEVMTRQAESAFYSTVMSDIVADRLIVREPLNFLRCNGIAEIQGLANAQPGPELMAVLVRFVVLDSDAIKWLEFHDMEIPDWLAPGAKKRDAGWSSSSILRSRQRRAQAAILETMIGEFAFPPLAIPSGGKQMLKNECLESHKTNFTPDGFDACWSCLVKANLIRSVNHSA